MARLACDDGLVMTLRPGIRRNHHTPTQQRYGADVGTDIPGQLELTNALQPLLERFVTAAGFHLVLFTVDETVFSGEIASLIAEHRLDEDEALETAFDLVTTSPERAIKL